MKNLALLLVFAILAMLQLSCSNSKSGNAKLKNVEPIDKIKNKTWEGQIYRIRDEKKLSDIRLKIVNDTMYVFSNAIFGSKNDTLTLISNNNQDSTCIFKNSVGDQFKLNYEIKNLADSGTFYLISNDFYIGLTASNIDISSSNALDFYLNINVPRNPDMYLDGAYEGTVEFENQLVNVFSNSVGSAKFKLVFLDNFKVRMYGSVLWDNSSEILPYKVKGDKIYIGTSKQKGGKLYEQGLKVTNNGLRLVYQGEDMNLILDKIY